MPKVTITKSGNIRILHGPILLGDRLRWKRFEDKYPHHFKRFNSMISRARSTNIQCYFDPGTDIIFMDFVKAIGPVPKNMIRPTVGRYDHSQGYDYDFDNKRWNFRWQEFKDNCKDTTGSLYYGTPIFGKIAP
jgi:hypothetical protein